MALTTIQIITAIAPALATDASLNTWIELATGLTDRCFFGSNYNLAVALRAAHMWSLSTYRSQGESGVVTSKREGQLGISYGGITVDRDLKQTQYGMQLYDLIHSSNPAITVLGACGATITCDT